MQTNIADRNLETFYLHIIDLNVSTSMAFIGRGVGNEVPNRRRRTIEGTASVLLLLFRLLQAKEQQSRNMYLFCSRLTVLQTQQRDFRKQTSESQYTE